MDEKRDVPVVASAEVNRGRSRIEELTAKVQ